MKRKSRKQHYYYSMDPPRLLDDIAAAVAPLTNLPQKVNLYDYLNRDKDDGVLPRLLTLLVTKAGGVQYVHLNEEATTILRGLDSWQRSKWVFPSENPATPLDARNFYRRVWGPAVTGVGIEWATWHDLRHTFASRLAMTGHNEVPLPRCCAIRPRPWSNGTPT